MSEMQKHFVTFYSPGTFVAEQTTRPIEDWDVDVALEMAHDILGRRRATPYGFRFTTRGRNDDELDSKVIKTSQFYFLGGEIKTIDDIKEENNPDSQILLRNMEVNKWDRIVVNNNSWKWTQPLNEEDVVLDFKPREKTS